jgi:hypothetical protein
MNDAARPRGYWILAEHADLPKQKKAATGTQAERSPLYQERST